MAEYGALGAELVGVSPDEVQTLVRFQKDMGVPQTFVSDPGRSIIRAYQAGLGAAGATTAKRVTFVISREGKIVYTVYDWNPLTNVGSVTRWLKEHPQI
ncbi:MAG: redoxin domain-containing protein [Candidatus Eremiobacteraeota bacterium]|nr:redoxin domain-containing protein [Candidatus Eremiobacteraeota bacterium]